MSYFSNQTRFASVRCAFSEEATWREALGGAEPLRVFVIDGPIDAPMYLPAGYMRAGLQRGFAVNLERPEQ
jgi:hypothetical protein